MNPEDNAWGSSTSSETNGYGSDTNTNNGESAYSASPYGGSVLDDNDVYAASGAFGTDQFQDGYSENPYEVNVFDTPYTESATNPNPKGAGYQAISKLYKPRASDYGDEQLVL